MMLSVTGVVVNAEEYTIQTISAQKEASITPAFEKKVQKSARPATKKKEGDCNIVTVGKYPTHKAAKADIGKAKAISKDAFIRPMQRTTPKVCESKTAAPKTAVKETNTTVVPKQAAVAIAPKETVAPTQKENVVTPLTPSIAKNAETSAPKAEPCVAQPCEQISTNVYLYDRNLARKSDIHEAIEFYKHSPYHSFRPVALQNTK